ncbi:MAG: hypothetical protein MZW92_76440 [Comamonadaceae bacterium]|nr:hypothetical protein [Comamonadaceae bacterium]
MLDSRGGDGSRSCNLDRRRARHRARAGDDRLAPSGSVIEAGLKCLQGKGIVNSISPQGGRGGVPASRRGCVRALRRGGRSSWPSTSRARPTRVERKIADLPARLPTC